MDIMPPVLPAGSEADPLGAPPLVPRSLEIVTQVRRRDVSGQAYTVVIAYARPVVF